MFPYLPSKFGQGLVICASERPPLTAHAHKTDQIAQFETRLVTRLPERPAQFGGIFPRGYELAKFSHDLLHFGNRIRFYGFPRFITDISKKPNGSL